MNANILRPTTASITAAMLDLLFLDLDLAVKGYGLDEYVAAMDAALNPTFRKQRIDAASTLLDIAVTEVRAVTDPSSLAQQLARKMKPLGSLAGSHPEISVVHVGITAWHDCVITNNAHVPEQVRLNSLANNHDPVEALFRTTIIAAHVLADSLPGDVENRLEEAFKTISSSYLATVGNAYLDRIGF